MKFRSYRALAATSALLVVSFLLGGLTYAQGGGAPAEASSPGGFALQATESATEPSTPGDETIPGSGSSQPPTNDTPGVGVEAPQALKENQPLLDPVTASLLDDVVQIQGRLTSASGSPITGSHSLTASIYDVAAGGTARCTDTDTVVVTDGLFTMSMDFCSASVFNGDQLYVGVKVDSDIEMTPRQPVFAVPYAWALRPGAVVKGADSYLFVPGNALVKNLSSDTTRWDIQANGAARVWRGSSAGTKVIYLPVTLPGVLYGQDVTVEAVTVYYRSQNGANSYISETDLYVGTDADSWLQIATDTNNHTSNVASSYTMTVTQNNVLSSSQGILGLFMYISFANDTEYLQIGGVRLRLGHQ